MTLRSELKRVGYKDRPKKRAYKGSYSVSGYTKKKLTKRDHEHVAWFVHKWPKDAGWKRKFHLSKSYNESLAVMKRYGLLGVIAAAGGYVNTTQLGEK